MSAVAEADIDDNEPNGRKAMLMRHARALVRVTTLLRDEVVDYVFEDDELARIMTASGDAIDAAIEIAEIASGQ